MSKNSAHFSLLNDTLLFQKYEFFIQFFCKNQKNSIFCEKFFGTENYCSKITMIFFFPYRYPIVEHSFKKFSKYLKNRVIFEFFFIFFFYEACCFAVFQPTYRKCMLGDNSILPVSESVPFKKQMWIFNVIFEKKIAQCVP